MNIPISLQLVTLLFAIVVHEFAHGWMAYRCGDDTAKQMNRLTLNPLAHIDIFGTILLPLFLIFSGSSFVFGWAKPVPINPANFNNPKNDIIKVGVAGPLSNIILAVVSTLLIWVIQMIGIFASRISIMIMNMLVFSVFINLLLAVFNLIPIPPLDGSQILTGFLTARQHMMYEKIRPYGMIIIMVLFFTGIIWRIVIPVVTFLQGMLFLGLKGF